MRKIIQSIITTLPSYPEEGGSANCVNKHLIKIHLLDRFDSTQDQAITTTLEFIENMLTSLSLLDSEALQRGEWRFVSHPAQLCALSLLHTLADPQQKLFPSGFWETAGVGDAERLQQKLVLESLENRRYAHHRTNQAQPIRFVYVAWGIIKLDDKILFHKREAIEHPNEYGLIGGRVNLDDLRKVMGEDISNRELLATLQSPHSESMLQAFTHTLQRECAEEAKLIFADDHYTFEVWRDLKPWQKCMGAAPNYALSQYFFRIFYIKLNTGGYLTLRRCLQQQGDRFIECNLAEVASGKTNNGAYTLRINALYDDFSDRQVLTQALKSLPPSYSNRYVFNEEKYGLIFSLEPEVLRGESGKEKTLALKFTQEQKSLLLGIAAHAKGLQFAQYDKNAITFHPYGWLEIHDAIVQSAINQLSEHLRQHDIPYLELHDTHYVRLSLPPELIFFDSELFGYKLTERSRYEWDFYLQRRSIMTVLGEVNTDSVTVNLKAITAKPLRNVVIGAPDKDTDNNLPKKIRYNLQDKYQALGLRIFLLIKNNRYTLSCVNLG